MSLVFTHETLGQRVILQTGAVRRHLAEEVDRLGAERLMLIGTKRSSADEISSGLPVALRWDEVAQHVPVDLAQRARQAADDAGVDLLVSVGGGSATGLAKAVAMTTRLPIVAVPTTYAGSEATQVWGLTDRHEKATGVDPAVLPTTVIYDSELTLSLPVHLSVASGFNGIAHCVDSMWAPATDPINKALALEGIRALSAGLRGVVAEPLGIEGRDQCLFGAYLAAVAFASAGSGLHHKICHVLGGAYDLPHAETHAIVLPHVLALNAQAVPEAAGKIAEAIGVNIRAGADPARTAVAALERLSRDVDAPRALKEVGMTERDIHDAATRVVQVAPPSNPVRVSQVAIEALLHAAWAGEPAGGHG